MTQAQDCPNIQHCPLFPRFQLGGALAVWQTN